MTNEFEKLLHTRGFTLLDEVIRLCNHELTSKSYIWYVQDCPCCIDDESWIEDHNKSMYLEWSKRICCQDCMDGNVSCQACGGHYNNIHI